MTNDAKLGLVIGIGVVILIAIVFFRRDAIPQGSGPELKAPNAIQAAGITTPAAVEPPAAASTPVLQPVPEMPPPPPAEPEPITPAAPKSRAR